MAIYQIADLRWKIDLKHNFAISHMQDYLVDGDTFDEELIITDDDLRFEKSLCPAATPGNCEFTAILRKICYALLYRFDGLFLHAATIVYNGKAYAFSAPPGTGKTTHCLLWHRVLGHDRVHFLNGDKLLIRFKDGKCIAYGNPWKGKEEYGCAEVCELDGFILLQRGLENSVKETSSLDKIRQLFKATVFPADGEGKLKLLDRLEQLIKTVDIPTAFVNMENDAVDTVRAYIDAKQ